MHREFWHKRWEQNQIGFHQQAINEYLSQHWAELGVAEGVPVFVPLCGKSLDMLWLREQGHAVTGIELSERALHDFFAESQLPYTVSTQGPFTEFRATGLRLLAGDFFALQADDLQGVSAVYDRASLIALPPDMRRDYVTKLQQLLPVGTSVLLITMQYAEGALDGPPFSVHDNEVRELYTAGFVIEKISEWPGMGPRNIPVQETVYHLVRR